MGAMRASTASQMARSSPIGDSIEQSHRSVSSSVTRRSYGHGEVAERVGEAHLAVGGLASLADDERARNAVLACRELLRADAGDHHAARRDETAMLDDAGAAHVENGGRCGEHNTRSEHRFGTHANAIDN